jgi:putative ABC transport system permease protein
MNISPGQNIRMALEAVWTHRFRSLLTILGVVIGITTVVTVASLLTGLRQGIVVFFDELGPDNVFVGRFSGAPQGNGPLKERKRRPLLPEYADIIKRTSGSVQDVETSLFLPNAVAGQVISAKVPGYETDNINIVGATSNLSEISPHEVESGRYYTVEEDSRGAHVAMLGHDVAYVLYPDGRAVGNTFMMDGAEYSIIGVFAKAKGGFFGQNGADTQITIPLKTAEVRYPQVNSFFFSCKAKQGRRKEAFDEVEGIMRRIRRLKTDTPDDFNLSTPDQIIQQFDSITGLIGLVAIAISGLGLLVGGIGVMNIMLVSVTERTREIGVRKALGARRRDVVGQFLTEAMALTGIGGVLGIVIAVLVTLLVSALVPSLPATVPAWALITGFSVSVAVGLFFGTWPAMKASRLDPVDALRYE